MIKKVHIENYKIFQKLDIEFHPDTNIIVGNNEAGKSTLFEAINLAFTKKLHNRPLEYELSPYLFNTETVKEYLKDKTAPEILIEVYFGDDFKDDDYKGINNTSEENCSGVKLSIKLKDEKNSDFQKYLKQQQNTETKASTLPIEYYDVEWLSFANNPITCPLRIQLINCLEQRYGQASNKYIASSINDNLDEDQKRMLALEFRNLKETFANNDKINELNKELIPEGKSISNKKIKISIDASARSQWDSILSLYVDDIPYSQIGRGEQNSISTKMALNKNAEEAKKDVIMIEEPEACLSFSNLNKLVNDICDRCKGKQLLINTHSSFLMNKIGIQQTILLNGDKNVKFTNLPNETYSYFQKLPGYDTLRIMLSEKSIFVEGPSDELVVQKAYLDKYGKLPIADGIDVISVRGLSFKRFLEIAKIMKRKIAVITDNDGKSEDEIKKRYQEYHNDCIEIFVSEKEKGGTLEPQVYNTGNNKEKLKELFDKKDEDLKKYFCEPNDNKTQIALKIFESGKNLIEFPKYIEEAIKYIREDQ